MKTHRFLFVLLLSAFFYTGCQKEEIAYYDQSPRINFLYGNIVPYNFCDTDYIKGNEYHDVTVWVELQGDMLTAPRDFVLKTSPNANDSMIVDVTVAEKYTYTALDTNIQKVSIKVKRPAKSGKRTDVYLNCLKFDIGNSAHQWDAGRADKDTCRVEVTYQLFPYWQNEWDEWTWGDYCDAKYLFMLDHFKVIYKDMPWDGGDIKTAYENYKKEHGPILDDDGEEIMFP